MAFAVSAESRFEHTLGTSHRQLFDERPTTRIRLEQEIAIRRCHHEKGQNIAVDPAPLHGERVADIQDLSLAPVQHHLTTPIRRLERPELIKSGSPFSVARLPRRERKIRHAWRHHLNDRADDIDEMCHTPFVCQLAIARSAGIALYGRDRSVSSLPAYKFFPSGRAGMRTRASAKSAFISTGAMRRIWWRSQWPCVRCRTLRLGARKACRQAPTSRTPASRTGHISAGQRIPKKSAGRFELSPPRSADPDLLVGSDSSPATRGCIRLDGHGIGCVRAAWRRHRDHFR